MAIASFDQYVAAGKQLISYTKTAAVTSVATTWFSVVQAAGNPGAGTMLSSVSVTAGSSSAGVVVDDTVSGYPTINVNTGLYYLSRVEFGNTVTARHMIYDRLWQVGMLLTATGIGTISSPGSYAARLPATNYVGLMIVVEIVAAVSGTATTVAVTYTNQAGTTARTTGASVSLSGFTIGRWIIMPLQAGDSGVQKIETVVVGGTVATFGQVNVTVIRPLWYGRVNLANGGDIHGIDRTGMPQIFQTSALGVAVNADSTATGPFDMQIEVASA